MDCPTTRLRPLSLVFDEKRGRFYCSLSDGSIWLYDHERWMELYSGRAEGPAGLIIYDPALDALRCEGTGGSWIGYLEASRPGIILRNALIALEKVPPELSFVLDFNGDGKADAADYISLSIM